MAPRRRIRKTVEKTAPVVRNPGILAHPITWTEQHRKGETLAVFTDFTKDAEAALIAQVKSNSCLFFRLAYGVVRDVQTAEDVCQQAFLRAWELRGRIRDVETLRAWLAKVVVNESLVVVRRRKTEQRARSLYPAPAENTEDNAETG